MDLNILHVDNSQHKEEIFKCIRCSSIVHKCNDTDYICSVCNFSWSVY